MATASGSVGLLKQLSRQSSQGLGDEFSLKDEIELLQNVYFNELEITQGSHKEDFQLVFKVAPSTADDKGKQFVYVEVTLSVDGKYPLHKPQVAFSKSRGLSDSHLDSILVGVIQLAMERLGTPMIYDLIEYIRDCLTDNNRPYGKCVLCQYEFQYEDAFIRTHCYHYFHSLCIANYSQYCKTTLEEDFDRLRMKKTFKNKKFECPVCRILLDESCLDISGAESRCHDDRKGVFKPSGALLSWQRRMSVLYQKQLAQGGIITDTDDVIDETWVSSGTKNDTTNDKEDTPTNKREDVSSDDTNDVEGQVKSSSTRRHGDHGNGCPGNSTRGRARGGGRESRQNERRTDTSNGSHDRRRRHYDKPVIVRQDGSGKDSRSQEGKRGYSRSYNRHKNESRQSGNETRQESRRHGDRPRRYGNETRQSGNESRQSGNETGQSGRHGDGARRYGNEFKPKKEFKPTRKDQHTGPVVEDRQPEIDSRKGSVKQETIKSTANSKTSQ